jgi:hypothetical protein
LIVVTKIAREEHATSFAVGARTIDLDEHHA